MNIGPDDLHLDMKAGAPGDDPELETALVQALRHVDAPAGFADRLLARALAGDRPGGTSAGEHPAAVPAPLKTAGKLLHWPESRFWVTGAVAAGLIAGVLEGGVALHHVREQQRRVVQATREFQTTERVTVRALAQAREQLQRAGVPLSLD